MTDEESAVFPIKQGTEQGDPSEQFAVQHGVQFALEDDLKKWKETKRRHPFEQQQRRLLDKSAFRR